MTKSASVGSSLFTRNLKDEPSLVGENFSIRDEVREECRQPRSAKVLPSIRLTYEEYELQCGLLNLSDPGCLPIVLSLMASPTNLTDRISNLRDRKGGSAVVRGETPQDNDFRQKEKRKVKNERRLADDYFMMFVYALLAFAFASQLFLIVWLDLF